MQPPITISAGGGGAKLVVRIGVHVGMASEAVNSYETF